MAYRVITPERIYIQYTIMDFIKGLTWEIINCSTQEGKKRCEEISAPRASNRRNTNRSNESSSSQSQDIHFLSKKVLNERDRRLFAGFLARTIGCGGIQKAARLTGLDVKTVRRGKFLRLDQTSVLESNIRLWGHQRRLTDNSMFTNLKPAYVNQYIQDTTDYLRTFIKILTGGKARIFILTDTGDANLGYQYLVPQQNRDGDIYKEALKSREWLPKGPSYFDVDLTSKNPQDRKILEHLVNVILGTTDLIVIKEEGGAIDDGKMLCAFNQYKFFRPNEILSGPSSGKVYDAYKYNNYQMIITAQSIKFYKRGSAWLNYMGWSFGSGSDFRNYINSIFNDPSNYLNQFLIRYN